MLSAIGIEMSLEPEEKFSLLSQIEEEFWECACSIRGDRVTPESLARRWLTLLENSCGHDLGQLAKQTIALRALQEVKEMDIMGNKWVRMDEWTHYGLLLATGGTTDLVTDEPLRTLAEEPHLLNELLHAFICADVTGSGSTSYDDLVALHGSSLFSPSGEELPLSKVFIRIELLKSDQDAGSFARSFLEAVVPIDAGTDLSSVRASYTQFIAYCVGRKHSEVKLHLYDLANGMAPKVTPWLLGRDVEAIWHTGIVAFDQEYFFTRDCGHDDPGSTQFGTPTRVVHLGHTLRRQDELHRYIVEQMKPLFHRDTYDVVTNNCNHFSDRVCVYLTGSHLPSEVLRQTEYLLASGAVRLAKPMLNWYLRDNVISRDAAVMGAEVDRREKKPLPLPGATVWVRPVSGSCISVLGVVCGEVDSVDKSMMVSYFDIGAASGRACCGADAMSHAVRTEVVAAERVFVDGLDSTKINAECRAAMSALKTGRSCHRYYTI